MLSMISNKSIATIASQSFRCFSTTSLTFKEAVATKSSTKVNSAKSKSTSVKEKKLTLTEAKKSERPKRPISSFSLYFKENISEFYKPGSGETTTNAMAAAAEKWKTLSDAVKDEYKQKTLPFRQEYEKANKEWQTKFKKPLSGYNMFVKERMSQLKAQTLDENKEILKNVAKEWNSLTKEEKNTWNTKSF